MIIGCIVIAGKKRVVVLLVKTHELGEVRYVCCSKCQQFSAFRETRARIIGPNIVKAFLHVTSEHCYEVNRPHGLLSLTDRPLWFSACRLIHF